MRIPRFAFVILIASLVVLASSLIVVKVRARGDGPVVLLSISAGSEKPVECALSTVDKQVQTCGLLFASVGTDVHGYAIRLLSRSDDRVELGVRAGRWPAEDGKTYGPQEFDRFPEQHFWFAPGDKLKIENPGLLTLTVTGTWMDHVPTFTGVSEVEPGPDEIRIISPLMLRDKQVIGDFQAASATQVKPNKAVMIYFPKQGSFLISNSQIQGAIKAEVNLNRISFEENGQQYVVVTGAQVTRAHHVWVLHQASYLPNPSGPNRDFPFMGGAGLRETEPGIWAPTMPMN